MNSNDGPFMSNGYWIIAYGEPVQLDSLDEYIRVYSITCCTKKPNYQEAGILVCTNLKIDAWERYLRDYPDCKLLHCLRFGFHLSIATAQHLHNFDIQNHFQHSSILQILRNTCKKRFTWGPCLVLLKKLITLPFTTSFTVLL